MLERVEATYVELSVPLAARLAEALGLPGRRVGSPCRECLLQHMHAYFIFILSYLHI